MSAFLLVFLQIASWVFIARALSSWLRIGPDSAFFPIVNGLHKMTEPVLAPIRAVLPSTGMMDFSVLVVILIINFILMPLAIAL